MSHKYHAVATQYDGYRFDSKRECQRYQELKLLEQTGKISQLSVHPLYYLQTSFTDNTGQRQRPIRYTADFAYTENGQKIVEDVKGVETAVFKLKAKIFKKKYPHLELRIVK